MNNDEQPAAAGPEPSPAALSDAQAAALPPEQVLAEAQRARQRERHQGSAATAARIDTGRWLRRVQRGASYQAAGYATLASWAGDRLGIGPGMLGRYLRLAAVPLAAVRGHELSVDKLALIGDAPGWLRPALAQIGAAAPPRVVRQAARAAAACFAACGDPAQAVAAARRRAAEPPPVAGRSREERLRRIEHTAGRLLEQLRRLGPRDGEAERLKLLVAALDSQLASAPGALPGPDQAQAGSQRLPTQPQNASGSKEMHPEERARPAQVDPPHEAEAAAPSAEGGTAAAPAAGPPATAAAPPEPAAPPPPGAGPPPICVSTQALVAALRAGLSDEEQGGLCNAFLGVLARHNAPWSRLGRRVLTDAARQAQHQGRLTAPVAAAFIALLDGPAEHFDPLFALFQELADLPCFPRDLQRLCQGQLSDAQRQQVQAAAGQHPRDPPRGAPPAAISAFIHQTWAAHAAVLRRLPDPYN